MRWLVLYFTIGLTLMYGTFPFIPEAGGSSIYLPLVMKDSGPGTTQIGTPEDDVQIWFGTPGNDYIYQYGFGGNDLQYAEGDEGGDTNFQDGGTGDDNQTAIAGDGNDSIIQYGG